MQLTYYEEVTNLLWSELFDGMAGHLRHEGQEADAAVGLTDSDADVAVAAGLRVNGETFDVVRRFGDLALQLGVRGARDPHQRVPGAGNGRRPRRPVIVEGLLHI